MKENMQLCKDIALELDKITEGIVYKCPECGREFEWDDTSYDYDESSYVCPHCTEAVNESDLDPVSMLDYFADALDETYYIGSNGDYKGVRITVTCGGPNIYVDTFRQTVELYWWTETATYDLRWETVNTIDDVFEELWNCR